MALKLAVGNVIDVPVKFSLQDGGAVREFAFTLEADRCSSDEAQALIKSDGAETRAFLLERVRGWRGQRLVLDDEDQPAVFSLPALGVMLDVSGVQLIVAVAYLQAVAAADSHSGTKKK